MAIVVPNDAEIILLGYMLNETTPDDPVCHLYKNDFTPGEATDLSDLTEVTESGYGPIALTGGWTISTDFGVTSGEHPLVTFSISASVDVFGYFVTNNSSSDLLWVERFVSPSPPFELVGSGDVDVTPKITLN